MQIKESSSEEREEEKKDEDVNEEEIRNEEKGQVQAAEPPKEEKVLRRARPKKTKKIEVAQAPDETEEPDVQIMLEPKEKKEEKWPEPEGQLAVDIYHTEDDLVVQSAIAGVKPEDLDISLERDILKIEGERKKPFEEDGSYFTQECYWGRFSRQIILPMEVNPDRVEAKLKEGVLTIRIPKIQRDRKRKIIIKM